MASRQKPAAGQDTPDVGVDPGAALQSTTAPAAEGNADDAAVPPPAPDGTDGAPTPEKAPAIPLAEPSPDAAAADAGVQLDPPKVERRAAATDRDDGGRDARSDPNGPSDPDAVIRIIAAERAHAERARRYREIPAEGVAIDPRDLNELAVHLDLDPGTVIAARQYPDRFVYVTRDGRKVEKDLG